MDHPKTFLLKKIIDCHKNGLNTLGQLNAKHIDDLSEVMKDFGETLISEVVERLNKGETITTFNSTFTLMKQKKR